MNTIMESRFEVLRKMHRVAELPTALVTAQGDLLCTAPASPPGSIRQEPLCGLVALFHAHNRDPQHPMVLYHEPGVFIGVAQLDEATYCILGPVCPLPLSYAQLLALFEPVIQESQVSFFCNRLLTTPAVTFPKFAAVLELILQCMGLAPIPTSEVALYNMTAGPVPEQAAPPKVPRSQTNLDVPEAPERDIYLAVRNGDERALQSHLETMIPFRAGVMSNDLLQQQRYFFVSLATMLCRAAQEGGLSKDDAYSLCDLYCRQMDELKTVADIAALSRCMCLAYCRRVNEANLHQKSSPVVRRCMAYISAHLNRSLSMEELALHCGKSSRALSRQFREETGRSVLDFIRDEKMREARHLLTHTDYSLLAISEFLRYPSQSYFTQVFKKSVGQTPQQYRLATQTPCTAAP